jgi:SAM-dependent methyltransferase
MLATRDTDLARWESAEVQRSRAQAVHAKRVKPTAAATVHRYADPPAGTSYELEYVFHVLGDIRGRTVLDLGCGDGKDTTLLAGKGARVYALDLSQDLLELAAARVQADGHADAVTFLCASAHSIPLPDASVDIVLGDAILHHLDLALVRAEVLRVLRPGGRAVFKEPIRESRLLRAVRPLIPYRQADVSPYERPLFRSEVDTFGQPFRRGRQREFRLPFVPFTRLFRLSPKLEDDVRALDARLLAKHRWLRTYATVTVFELIKP